MMTEIQFGALMALVALGIIFFAYVIRAAVQSDTSSRRENTKACYAMIKEYKRREEFITMVNRRIREGKPVELDSPN